MRLHLLATCHERLDLGGLLRDDTRQGGVVRDVFGILVLQLDKFSTRVVQHLAHARKTAHFVETAIQRIRDEVDEVISKLIIGAILQMTLGV